MSEDRQPISIDDVTSAVGTLTGFLEQSEEVIRAAVSRAAEQWLETEGATSAAKAAWEIVADIVPKLSDVYIGFDDLQGQLVAAQDALEEQEEAEKQLTKEELEAGLAQFYGSEQWYKASFGGVMYTDGVKFLADHAGAYWLIDAVASYQGQPALRGEEFQAWRLTVDLEARAAVLVADDGNGNELARQVIEYTDFPLEAVTLYLVYGSLDGVTPCWILMLPNEY